MRTPPVVGSAASETFVGSDEDQLAELPSVVTAGTWKVCDVLSVTNAEYIGEKETGIVGLAHEPGVELLTPAPPSEFPFGGLPPASPFPPTPVFELPEHAATRPATPRTPADRAVRKSLRFESEFIRCSTFIR
jgi:hypothetical protein